MGRREVRLWECRPCKGWTPRGLSNTNPRCLDSPSSLGRIRGAQRSHRGEGRGASPYGAPGRYGHGGGGRGGGGIRVSRCHSVASVKPAVWRTFATPAPPALSRFSSTASNRGMPRESLPARREDRKGPEADAILLERVKRTANVRTRSVSGNATSEHHFFSVQPTTSTDTYC